MNLFSLAGVSSFFVRKASQDAMLLFGLQCVVQLNSFIATLFVARFLGPTNLGLVSFTQTFITFCFILNSGLDSFYMWKLAGSPSERDIIVKRCFTTKAVSNIASFIIGVMLVPFLSHSPTETLIFLCSLVVAYIAYSIGFVPLFLLTEKRIKEYVTASLLTSAIILCVRIGLVLNQSPVYYFIFTLLGEAILFVSILLLKKNTNLGDYSFLKKNFLQESIKEIFLSRYHILTVIASLVFTKIDQFFIKNYINVEQLGYYSAAVRLVEHPIVLGGILTTIMIPRISKANSSEARKKVATFGFVGFMSIAFLFLFLFLIFGEDLIKLIYGEKFSNSIPLLHIYAWILPGFWLHLYASIILASYDKMKVSMYICLIAGVVALFVLSILVPSQGIYGVLTSALIVQNILGLLSFGSVIYFFYKKRSYLAGQ